MRVSDHEQAKQQALGPAGALAAENEQLRRWVGGRAGLHASMPASLGLILSSRENASPS